MINSNINIKLILLIVGVLIGIFYFKHIEYKDYNCSDLTGVSCIFFGLIYIIYNCLKLDSNYCNLFLLFFISLFTSFHIYHLLKVKIFDNRRK